MTKLHSVSTHRFLKANYLVAQYWLVSRTDLSLIGVSRLTIFTSQVDIFIFQKAIQTAKHVPGCARK